MSTIPERNSTGKTEEFNTIVIGGGQAGLAAGYFLSRSNASFVILDRNPHTGDSWRQRWDSLRLFTPSKANGLPGESFPLPPESFPTKEEVAAYLENYAVRFNLPVRHAVTIERLSRRPDGFIVSASEGILRARNVIIATGSYQSPFIPAFADQLNPALLQIHSSAYRNPGQFPAHSVLVVGAGNSGAEIAYELVKSGRKIWLAGRDVGRIPFQTPLGKAFGGRPMWWFVRNVMTVNTPIGRKMIMRGLGHGGPLGRLTRREIAAAGVELVPHLAGILSGQPQLEDGRLLTVDGVVWATGYRPDYHWVDLPVFNENGFPRHARGVVPEALGLYFLGLPFQTGLSSALLGGIGMDAKYIVGQIDKVASVA